MARIEPMNPPYEADVAQQLDKMMPPGVPPISLFRTFVRNLPMSQAMTGWGNYYLSKAWSLTMRDREIVIDRTSARCSCEYEFGVHVMFFAARVGFTDDQVASLAVGGPTDECWTSERDRLLIRSVDSLHDTSDLDDDLWAEMSAVFADHQLLDVMLLCGWYHAVCFAANAARVTPEPGAPRFADYGAASRRP